MVVALTEAGVERIAVMYAATPASPTWPKESIPVLPTKIWVPTTMTPLIIMTSAMCRAASPPVA